MTATIRSIDKKEDLKFIAKINGLVQAFPWSAESLRLEVESPLSSGWVATMPGKVTLVGYILVRRSHGEAEVMTLGVHPEFQRNGIARTLISKVVSDLLPGTALLLEVSHLNEGALSLYKTMGFEIFSTRKSYYPDGSDAVCMKLNIAKA